MRILFTILFLFATSVAFAQVRQTADGSYVDRAGKAMNGNYSTGNWSFQFSNGTIITARVMNGNSVEYDGSFFDGLFKIYGNPFEASKQASRIAVPQTPQNTAVQKIDYPVGMPQKITYEYYPIIPQMGRSIYKELVEDTPLRHEGRVVFGRAHWQIGYETQYSSENTRMCKLTQYNISNTCHVILPKLITNEKTLNYNFDQYMVYLKQHELTHCKIANDYAALFDKQLSQLKLQQSMACQTLTNTIESSFNANMAEVRRKQALFDQQNSESKNHFDNATYYLADLYPEKP